MPNRKNTGKNQAKKQVQNPSEFEVDFGNRKIASQNFSKLVTLPKEALANCGCNVNDKNIQMDVKLVQKDGEKYIKLTPVCNTDTEEIEEEKKL